jgi:hypothetical protein
MPDCLRCGSGIPSHWHVNLCSDCRQDDLEREYEEKRKSEMRDDQLQWAKEWEETYASIRSEFYPS